MALSDDWLCHHATSGASGLPWPEAYFGFVLRGSDPRRNADLEKARRLPFPGFYASDVNNRGVIVGGIVTDGAAGAKR